MSAPVGSEPSQPLDRPRHNGHGLHSPPSKQRGRTFGQGDLTMPEGFSQEIFPLTYTNNGTAQFPSASGGHGRRGTDSRT